MNKEWVLYLIFILVNKRIYGVEINKREYGGIDFGMGEWEGGGITMTPPPVEVRLELPRQESAEPLRNDL